MVKSPAILTAVLVLVAGTAVLCARAEPAMGGLFFVPFSLGPVFVSLALAIAWRRRTRSQWTLAVGHLLYALWFGLVYFDVFHGRPDPQGPIAFLFVGLYALPVMLVVWIVAGLGARRARDPA